MTRALLWKELRMQRPVLFAGIAAAILGPLVLLAFSSPPRPFAFIGVGSALAALFAAAWPLLGVAAGAIPFATEAEDGTARFLLSRPVGRGRVWCTKVGAALATFVAIGMLWLLSVSLVAAAIGPPPPNYPAREAFSDTTIFSSWTVVGLGTLFFACGLLCSVVVTRPLTAAAAAVAVGLAVLSVIFTAWSAAGLSPNLEPQWLGAEMIVVAAMVIGVSLLIFLWPEQFRRRSTLGIAGRAGIVATLLLTTIVIVMPLGFAALTLGVTDAAVVPGSVTHNGRHVALTFREGTGTTQNWLLMTDGSGVRPFTGRHTLAPQWLAGRNYIAFYARRGWFGREAGVLDLRITDVQAARSWTVLHDVPGVRELYFHGGPANGAVAFVDGERIGVARLNGYDHRSIATAGTPLEDATLLGFSYRVSSNGSRQLLMVGGDYDVAGATLRRNGPLFLYEIDTGAVRELHQLQAGSVLPARLRNPAPGAREALDASVSSWSTIPLLAVQPADEDAAARAKLIRIAPLTGETHEVHDIPTAWADDAGRAAFHRCAALELAPDRRWRPEEPPGRTLNEDQVLFGDCSATTRAELPAGAVRLVGVRTGNVVTWPLPAGWQGRLNRIHLAQSQRTVLLDVRGATPAQNHAITLALDGTVHTYPAGWTPVGWTTLDFFLLQREQAGTVAFAIGDTRTGEIHGLFPDNELPALLEQRRLEQQLANQAAATRR